MGGDLRPILGAFYACTLGALLAGPIWAATGAPPSAGWWEDQGWGNGGQFYMLLVVPVAGAIVGLLAEAAFQLLRPSRNGIGLMLVEAGAIALLLLAAFGGLGLVA